MLAPQMGKGLPLSSRLLDQYKWIWLLRYIDTVFTVWQWNWTSIRTLSMEKCMLRYTWTWLKQIIYILSLIIRKVRLNVICIQSHNKPVTHSSSYFMFWKNGLMKGKQTFSIILYDLIPHDRSMRLHYTWPHTTWPVTASIT